MLLCLGVLRSSGRILVQKALADRRIESIDWVITKADAGKIQRKGIKEIRGLVLLVRQSGRLHRDTQVWWYKAIDIRCLVEALGGDTTRLSEANLEDGETRRINNG